MAARIARRAARARDRAADRVPRSAARRSPRTDITVQDARDGEFVGSEIPADLQRQWIQGTGPAAKPGRAGREEHPQRRLRAAVGRRRLDVRRRGRARPGLDDVAGQPAQPEAGHPSRSACSSSVAEQVAGEMNSWAQGFFGRADHRRLADAARLHDEDLPRARPAPRRPPRPARRRRRLLRVDRRRRALRRQQPPAPARSRRVARAVPAEDPDRRGSGAVERHPRRRSSSTSACRTARSRSTCSSSRSRRASS